MQFSHEANRVFAINEEGRVIAEVTFPNIDQLVVNINHTFVDPSLRGQGAAALLMQEAYQSIKTQNKKAVLTCSYAIKWFGENLAFRDIVQERN